ncbi:hypothetical protein ACTXML_16970 [Glutamicibacter arilaitensis]|uniref:hypothetical protein n=1 Tax=Glutamicibacter arilaitensis TaxID=256701 RepID=UPI003FD42B54
MYRGPVAIIERESGAIDPITGRRYKIFGSHQVASHETGIIVFGFQGSGVIDDVFISNIHSAKIFAQRFSSLNQILDLLKESTGSFTIQLLDTQSGESYFLNDPLGGGLIVRYLDKTIDATAVDVISMKIALHLHGVSLSRSIDYQISRLGTGTASFGGDLPYDELTVLPPGIGIRLDRNGLTSTIDYGSNSYLYEENHESYENLIDLGVDQIRRNVTAVSDIGSSVLHSDITGGFDSRLVLAGILSSGNQSKYILTSIFQNKEWEYAEGLARTLDIPLTQQRGWVRSLVQHQNFYESCVGRARPSGGVIPNDLDPLAGPSSSVSLQGGYGETFRTFSNYYMDPKKDTPFAEMCAEMWKWTKLSRLEVEGKPLFRKDSIARLASSTERVFNRGVNFDLGVDLYPNFLYLQLRNRYWIGQQSYWSSRIQVRFDPLYNIHLIAAAHKLDFWRRKANFVGLDAMKGLSQNLMAYPWFEGDRVTNMYRKEKFNPPSAEFDTGAVRIVENPLAPPYEVISELPRDNYTSEDYEISKSLNIPVSTSFGIRIWGKKVKELLLENEICRTYFSAPGVYELFDASKLDRSRAETIRELISMCFQAGLLVPDNISPMDKFMMT